MRNPKDSLLLPGVVGFAIDAAQNASSSSAARSCVPGAVRSRARRKRSMAAVQLAKSPRSNAPMIPQRELLGGVGLLVDGVDAHRRARAHEHGAPHAAEVSAREVAGRDGADDVVGGEDVGLELLVERLEPRGRVDRAADDGEAEPLRGAKISDQNGTAVDTCAQADDDVFAGLDARVGKQHRLDVALAQRGALGGGDVGAEVGQRGEREDAVADELVDNSVLGGEDVRRHLLEAQKF